MINEIINKVKNKLSLSDTEINILLSDICSKIRIEEGIIDPMDSNCKVCEEVSKKFGIITFI